MHHFRVRRIRMRVTHLILLAFVMLALLLGLGFRQLEFVWGAIVTFLGQLAVEFIWQQVEAESAASIQKIDNLGSPQGRKERIEQERSRIRAYAKDREKLRSYTVAVRGVVLLHWAIAGVLGLSATLPQFVVKMAPPLSESLQSLDVFISWLAMLSYVMFLLGIWYSYCLWRVQENVVHLERYELECKLKLAKLGASSTSSTPQRTS
jgi:Sec-independent protein secretion pathway component TatC